MPYISIDKVRDILLQTGSFVAVSEVIRPGKLSAEDTAVFAAIDASWKLFLGDWLDSTVEFDQLDEKTVKRINLSIYLWLTYTSYLIAAGRGGLVDGALAVGVSSLFDRIVWDNLFSD